MAEDMVTAKKTVKKTVKRKAVKRPTKPKNVIPSIHLPEADKPAVVAPPMVACEPCPPEEFVMRIFQGYIQNMGMGAFSKERVQAMCNPDTLGRMYDAYVEVCLAIRSRE